MAEYHRVPTLDPQAHADDPDSLELLPPGTASKPYPHPQQNSAKEQRFLWWITAGLVFNVVILLLNLYLATSIGSKLSSMTERPLSELPRPDPLYGVRHPG
ncbi:hypothetical protein NMY22_g5165 [Coprinellus aureogranulatus]|nr:hypothetical protein NMY22_g5165 [Coprinellus aureogranulatus]